MAKGKQYMGLGKGLGDLSARTDKENTRDTTAPFDQLQDGSYFVELPPDQTVLNPRQPRHVLDEDDLNELVASIGELGVLQPVVVREVASKHFELIIGECWFRASKIAGKETIPIIARRTDNDVLLRDALLESLHHVSLNPLKGVLAYQQLLGGLNYTKGGLSQQTHRSYSQISNTLRLLDLPSTVQTKVTAGVLSVRHARALLGLINQRLQELPAERIIVEGLSVRSTEEVARLSSAPIEEEPAPRVRRLPSERGATVTAPLFNHFDIRVKVIIGENKGRITIEFAFTDDPGRTMVVIDGRTVESWQEFPNNSTAQSIDR